MTWLGRANDDHPDVEIQLRAAEIAPWLFDDQCLEDEEIEWNIEPCTRDESRGYYAALRGDVPDKMPDDEGEYLAGYLAYHLMPIADDWVASSWIYDGELVWEAPNTPELLAWRAKHGMWPGDRAAPPVFGCDPPRRYPMLVLRYLDIFAELINRGSFHGVDLVNRARAAGHLVEGPEISDAVFVAEERGLITRGKFEPTSEQMFFDGSNNNDGDARCYHWITRTVRWMTAETFGYGTEIAALIRPQPMSEAA